MKRMEYKSYEIEAVPHQLADCGEWTTEIAIVRDRGSDRNYRKFSASNTYKMEEDAIRHCFDFAKQIIDGKVENCSVVDL